MTNSKTLKNYGVFIDRNYRLIKQSYLKAFKEAQIDITTEQWTIIDNLSREDGLSQNDLAAKSFKNAPTVSRIIDLLVKKGWIERKQSEEDRRSFFVHLTNEGAKTHKALVPHVQKLRMQGWENLSEEDFADLQRIMNTIYTNFSSI